MTKKKIEKKNWKASQRERKTDRQTEDDMTLMLLLAVCKNKVKRIGNKKAKQIRTA